MSLNYQKEEKPEINESVEKSENDENVQRASFGVPFYSVVIIAFLVLVFICQAVADGADTLGGRGKISVALAGFVKPFFGDGQYWRILTGAVLHNGIMHIAFNSYALYSFGRLIETLANRAHLAIVFLLSALGGGVLSYIFLPEGISVGASGGILGFLGYMTVYSFKRRNLLPEGFLKSMLINVGFIAFVGVFLLPNIDNFAHLGGFLVGAIYGFLQIPSDLYKDPRETSKTTEIVGFAAFGIIILTAIFSILLLLGIIQIKLN